MFRSGQDTGWGYRVAVVRPLFCDDCAARHQAELLPVTDLERVASVLTLQLLIPTFGLGLFGGFILLTRGLALLLKPSDEWPLIAGADVLLLIAMYCARSAWRDGARGRIPAPTNVSACFDFGDNDGHATFEKTARTNAIRHANYAIAFDGLNNQV